MRFTNFIIFLLAGMLTVPGISFGEEQTKSTVATDTVNMKIEGMSCAGCASSLKSALQKVKGVQNAEVSFEKKEATVVIEKGKVKESELTDSVKKSGFKATVVQPEKKKNKKNKRESKQEESKL